MKQIISVCGLLLFVFTCFGVQAIDDKPGPVVIYYQQTVDYSQSRPALFRRSIAFSTIHSTPWKLHFENSELLDSLSSSDSTISCEKRGTMYHYTLEPAQILAESVELTSEEELSIDSMRVEQGGKQYQIQYLQFEETSEALALPTLKELIKYSVAIALQDISPERDCWCEADNKQQASSLSSSSASVMQEIQLNLKGLIPEQQSSRALLGESLLFTTRVTDNSAEDEDLFPETEPFHANRGEIICLKNQCPKGRQMISDQDDNSDPQQGNSNNYTFCPNFSCFTYKGSGEAGENDNASAGNSGNDDNPPPGHRTGPLGTASLAYTLAKNRHTIAMTVGAFVGLTIQEATVWFICTAPSQRREGEGWWDCVTRVSEAGSKLLSGAVGAGLGLAFLGCLNNRHCYCRHRSTNLPL